MPPILRQIRSLLEPLWHRLQQTRGVVLVILGCIAGGTWMFVELADEVTEGETQTIDEKILLALRNPVDKTDPIGPAWVEDMGRDFTALGGAPVLILLVLAVAGYLFLIRKPRIGLFIVAAILSGTVASTVLKLFFDRPRPDLVPHGSYVYTSSFPSGHSMISAVTYLTLAMILSHVHKPLRIKAYFIGMAILFTILVGVSRVYLGVHWPSDVLAGWTAGAVWALLCDRVADWLQRRHQIEGEEQGP